MRGGGMTTPNEPMTSTAPMNVLLVDDDVLVLNVLRRILERAGFTVVSATRREEARALLAPGRFDAIVSDINLPDDSGLTLLADARAADEEVPVVLLTGGPSMQTAIRAVELGAFRYLLKPTPSNELVAVVRSAAHVHRLAKLKSEALLLFGRRRSARVILRRCGRASTARSRDFGSRFSPSWTRLRAHPSGTKRSCARPSRACRTQARSSRQRGCSDARSSSDEPSVRSRRGPSRPSRG